MSNMFISGIASGIDWNSMMDQIMQNARRPALVQLQRRDTLELRKSLFEEFLVSLRAFQSTLAPLRLNSTFNAKSVIVDNLSGAGSHRSVANVSVNADAAVAAHDLIVHQIARAQMNRSVEIRNTVADAMTNALIPVENTHFYVRAAGQNVRIDVRPGDSLNDLANRINTQLQRNVPPLAISALVVDNRLVLRSDNTGTDRFMVSNNIRRAASGPDIINFQGMASFQMEEPWGANNAALVIRSGNNHFHRGIHFDIVNGNEIHWYDHQRRFPVTDNFDITYTAVGGERFDVSATRSSGSFDEGVLPVGIVNSAIAIDANTPRTARVVITDGTMAPDPDPAAPPGALIPKQYIEGVHFDIVGDNSIFWRDGEDRPAAGASMTISYIAQAGERFSINATRNNTDAISHQHFLFDSIFDNRALTIHHENRTYIQNTHFTVDAASGTITWISGATPAPPPRGTTYEIRAHNANGTFDAFSAIRALTGNDDAINPPSLTVRYGNITYTQGVHFNINVADNTIEWLPAGLRIAPPPSEAYEIRWHNASGHFTTFSTARQADDSLDLANFFNNLNDLANPMDPTSSIAQQITVADNFSLTHFPFLPVVETRPGANDLSVSFSGTTATFSWTPQFTNATRQNVPQFHPTAASGQFTVEYTFNRNTFHLDDGGNGILAAMGLDKPETEAQDAIVELNGVKHTFSNNRIGPDDGFIEGVTIELRNAGHLYIEVEHDVNPAVEAINTFLTAYNDIMRWINTRLTEREVDDSVRSTMRDDDVRWRWGLLQGNSLLRTANHNLRRLTSQAYVPAFSQRTSRMAIHGTMSQNGVTGRNERINLTVGIRSLSVPVRPEFTLSEITAWINTDSWDPASNTQPPGYTRAAPPRYEDYGFFWGYHEQSSTYRWLNPLHFDPEGRRYPAPFVRAAIVDNRLELRQGEGEVNRPVRLGGSNTALTALGLRYDYTTLSQIGLGLPSTGGGLTEAARAGELEFNTSRFMDAMRDNPNDVAILFNGFAIDMQAYLDNMVRTSQVEVAPGITTAQGAVAREMNAIDDQIRIIDRYLVDFERRLENRQRSIFQQFSQAEVAMGRLLQQASWLASVTAQLQAQNFNNRL